MEGAGFGVEEGGGLGVAVEEEDAEGGWGGHVEERGEEGRSGGKGARSVCGLLGGRGVGRPNLCAQRREHVTSCLLNVGVHSSSVVTAKFHVHCFIDPMAASRSSPFPSLALGKDADGRTPS